MRYKIIDKHTKQAVHNFAFTSVDGIVHKKPFFIHCSKVHPLVFSNKKDAENTASRLGKYYKVVELWN